MVQFIGILAFTWLFVEGAAPIQFVKKILKIHNESQPKDIYRQLIQKLVNCHLCSGFWVGLIYYQDLLMACVVSMAAEMFARILKLLYSKILNQL